MTTCIKCGQPVPDGELFCDSCSLNPDDLDLEPHRTPRPQTPPQGRMKAPVRQTPQRRPAPPPAQKVVKKPVGLIAALCIVSLLALGFLALNLYQYFGMQTQRSALRVRESVLEEQEEAYAAMETQLAEATAQLAQAERTLESQLARIDQLEAGISDAQSSASQNQYDMNAQKAELEELRAENTQLRQSTADLEQQKQALEDTLLALEASVTELQETVDALTMENDDLTEKGQFMDAYVVFVENDKTGLYHRYDCAAFAQKSFWAYSRKLAENNGFHPCPACIK